MTTPTHADDRGSQQTPAQDAGMPMEKTTVKNVSAPGTANTVGAQKRGLGGVLAWLTIPGIILLVLIVSYFFLSAMKSNTEQNSNVRGDVSALTT